MSLAASGACMTAMCCSHDQFGDKIGQCKAFGLFDVGQCM